MKVRNTVLKIGEIVKEVLFIKAFVLISLMPLAIVVYVLAAETHPDAEIWYRLGYLLLPFTLYLYYRYWLGDTSDLNVLKWKKNSTRYFAIGVLTTAVALLICTVVALHFEVFRYKGWGTARYSSGEIALATIKWGVVANLLAAIGEEIVYRGYLLSRVHSITKSSIIALVVSALVFSLSHFERDTLFFVRAFFAGLWFGYVFIKTQSLGLVIGCHWGWNFTADILSTWDSAERTRPHLLLSTDFKPALGGNLMDYCYLAAILLAFLFFKLIEKKLMVKAVSLN